MKHKRYKRRETQDQQLWRLVFLSWDCLIPLLPRTEMSVAAGPWVTRWWSGDSPPPPPLCRLGRREIIRVKWNLCVPRRGRKLLSSFEPKRESRVVRVQALALIQARTQDWWAIFFDYIVTIWSCVCASEKWCVLMASRLPSFSVLRQLPLRFLFTYFIYTRATKQRRCQQVRRAPQLIFTT